MDSPASINSETCIPLIALPEVLEKNSEEMSLTAQKVVDALRTSGFLLITSSYVPQSLQKQAVQAAESILNRDERVIVHPTDPKKYIMLESLEGITKLSFSESEEEILLRYWNALEEVKRQLLKCIAVGLNLDWEYFTNLHRQNNSALRLLHYPGSSPIGDEFKASGDTQEPQIRCKPHSDYGSVTILLTDGVPGLQALIEKEWTPVPFEKGALIVNIGSLLSDWTNDNLQATLHRVVAVGESKARTSLAFFADPDEEVSSSLKAKETSKGDTAAKSDLSVAEYIQWRSGGSGSERSGLAFTDGEAKRAKEARAN